ncbi:hypothetical protein ACWM35_20295 [Neobacillus sp. K501]
MAKNLEDRKGMEYKEEETKYQHERQFPGEDRLMNEQQQGFENGYQDKERSGDQFINDIHETPNEQALEEGNPAFLGGQEEGTPRSGYSISKNTDKECQKEDESRSDWNNGRAYQVNEKK